MTEYEEAIAIASSELDRPNADPDSDICILARNFLRSIEKAGVVFTGQEEPTKFYGLCDFNGVKVKFPDKPNE